MEMAISLRGDSLLEFPVHLTENADRSQSEKDKKKRMHTNCHYIFGFVGSSARST